MYSHPLGEKHAVGNSAACKLKKTESHETDKKKPRTCCAPVCGAGNKGHISCRESCFDFLTMLFRKKVVYLQEEQWYWITTSTCKTTEY